MHFSVASYLTHLSGMISQLDQSMVESAIALIKDHWNQKRKIIVCGNGGSALTASHYINDWNKMAYLATGKPFRGHCLSDNANGGVTLAICGYDGGKVRKIAQHCLWIQSFDMQICEDLHFVFGHMVMKSLCGDKITT